MLPFCDVDDFEIAIFSIKNLMKLIKYIFKIIFNLSQLKLCARKAKVYLFRRPMRVQRRLFRQYGFVTISHVVEIAFLISFDLACTRIHTGKRTLAEKYRTFTNSISL